MIDSYEFFRIVVNGRRHTSDVIIFLDRVIDGWWRREGHRLYIDDLTKVLNAELKPELLIVGTGYLGLMKVSNELEEALMARRMGLWLNAQSRHAELLMIF